MVENISLFRNVLRGLSAPNWTDAEMASQEYAVREREGDDNVRFTIWSHSP